MIDISRLRNKKEFNTLAIGSNPGIIQSILDFDFLSGKENPFVVAILAGGRKNERYFFGKKEILLPVFNSLHLIPESVRKTISLFINLSSARRVLDYSKDSLNSLPGLLGGSIFGENVPEAHSIELSSYA